MNGRGVYIEVGGLGYWLSPVVGGVADPENDSFRTYTFEELKELELPKPTPIIENLIHPGETILIAGRPKVGKTRLVQQMALSMAEGVPFLGNRVPRPLRILMVDLEDRPWAIRDRLIRMSGDRVTNGLFIACAESLSSDHLNSSPEGLSRLRATILKYEIEVLIIDPWRLWLGKDENNAEEVVRGLKASLASLRDVRPELA